MWNLLKHELFSRWLAILGWGLGLTGFASIYISVYPDMQEEMASLGNLAIYRVFGLDMGSFAGFMGTVVVGIVPLFLGVWVVMASTAAVAGEDDDGTLELIVAMPLPRWQIISMKALAHAIALLGIVLLLSAGSGAVLGYIGTTTEVDVTAGQMFIAMLSTYPMQLGFFAIGFFIGALFPSRRLAVAAMSVVFIGSYLIQSILNLVDGYEFLAPLSLFTYVDSTADAFTQGPNYGDMAILFVIAAVFFVAAGLVFERRNITTGQWAWQGGQVAA